MPFERSVTNTCTNSLRCVSIRHRREYYITSTCCLFYYCITFTTRPRTLNPYSWWGSHPRRCFIIVVNMREYCSGGGVHLITHSHSGGFEKTYITVSIKLYKIKFNAINWYISSLVPRLHIITCPSCLFEKIFY